ncbi:MAG: hypothetical protein JJ975_11050, partial [Bacteroidia bacterium]|nr:hypothetical protein [Bacteroidia bacterium]
LIFLSTWLVISIILGQLAETVKETEEKEGRISSNRTLINVSTLAVALFSLYLCVAAIVAAPELMDEEISHDATALREEFNTKLKDFNLIELDELTLSKSDTALLALSQLGEEELVSTYRNAVNSHNAWVNEQFISDLQHQERLTTEYEASLKDGTKAKQRRIYKNDLVGWYSDFHKKWTQQAVSRKSMLVNILNEMREVVSGPTGDSIQPISSDRVQSVLGSIKDYSDKQELASLVRPQEKPYPRKQSVAEDYGFFRAISSWLLQTGSLSLALIAGLFGFGLFGSIGSTFIRRRLAKLSGKVETEAIVLGDLQGILINGVSAAIVVFLGVKGAVLAFTQEGGELNPYMLFFTCLVASVFSEDVWVWARKKLNETLGR